MVRMTGRYERSTVSGEEVFAFVPHALPPTAPRPPHRHHCAGKSFSRNNKTHYNQGGDGTGGSQSPRRNWARTFSYKAYLELLQAGTELD